MSPVALRLLNQQLVSPQFSNPEEVVSHMGAMQAQEYRMMRWAVAMRTRKPSLESFRKAYDNGKIIRLHLLRGTWQLVSGEDYPWMLELCAAKARSVIKGWMSANKINIPDEEYAAISKILEKTTTEKGSATKEDFVEALAVQDLHMDEHRLSYHIRMAELNGLLCSGDLTPMKATYALTARKVKSSKSMSREEALATMARKFFQSRCPATLEDFVWWSGLNIGDCRKAIASLSPELHVETWNGQTYYLSDRGRIRGFKKGSVLLIPPYDEYLIGYKDRTLVLPAQHRYRAHSNNGIFYPVIARDGLLCGNWKPYVKNLQVEFFGEENLEGLEKEWARYQQYAQIGSGRR